MDRRTGRPTDKSRYRWRQRTISSLRNVILLRILDATEKTTRAVAWHSIKTLDVVESPRDENNEFVNRQIESVFIDKRFLEILGIACVRSAFLD